MYAAVTIRHGPKKDDPNLHLIPGAVTLDEKADQVIRDYANDFIIEISPYDITVVNIYSTIVKRASQTAQILYDFLSRQEGLVVKAPRFDSIGSYINHNGQEINLSSNAMSKEWQRGKQIEWEEGKYARGIKKEDLPLLLWCQKGFDNHGYFGLDLPKGDSGVSLRETAARVGDYILSRLDENEKCCGATSESKADLIISHSGDLEPWLFLTLAMIRGHDSSKEDYMVEMFNHIGGGLMPMEGISVLDEGYGLVLRYHNALSFLPDLPNEEPLGKDILQEQRRWVKEHGIGDKVLEQRLKSA